MTEPQPISEAEMHKFTERTHIIPMTQGNPPPDKPMKRVRLKKNVRVCQAASGPIDTLHVRTDNPKSNPQKILYCRMMWQRDWPDSIEACLKNDFWCEECKAAAKKWLEKQESPKAPTE